MVGNIWSKSREAFWYFLVDVSGRADSIHIPASEAYIANTVTQNWEKKMCQIDTIPFFPRPADDHFDLEVPTNILDLGLSHLSSCESCVALSMCSFKPSAIHAQQCAWKSIYVLRPGGMLDTFHWSVRSDLNVLTTIVQMSAMVFPDMSKKLCI